MVMVSMKWKQVLTASCGLAALMGGTSGYAKGRSVGPVPAASSQVASPTPVPAGVSYGALWETANGYTSAVMLRNDGSASASAQVQLYAANGQSAGSTQVQVAAHSTAHVALSGLGSAGEGGLLVQQTAGAQRLVGRVLITDPAGSIVTYPLQGGYRYDTEQSLWTPWWLPDSGTDGSLKLFNTSAQSIVVSPSVTVDGVQKKLAPVTLSSNSSNVLSLRSLLERAGFSSASVGALTIRYSGQAHALQPLLLLSNIHTGFALIPDFNADHQDQAQQQTTWQFPHVALTMDDSDKAETFSPYALISNDTNTQMVTQVTAYSVSDGQIQQIPLGIPALAPHETRQIDLSQFMQQIIARPSRLALSVSHAGQPGDLGISIFSMNLAGQVAAQSEGVVLPVSTGSLSYWDVSSGHVLVHRIKSATGSSTTAQANLFYQTPTGLRSFRFPGTIAVNDDKDESVNMSQIIRSNPSDDSGSRLSSGVQSGLLVLSPAGAAPELNDSLATCSTQCSTEAKPVAGLVAAPSIVFLNTGPTPACVVPPAQVPTSSRIISTVSSNATSGCPAGQAGWDRTVLKAVTDQNGSDIAALQSLTEGVIIGTRNDLALGQPQTFSANTNSAGQFTDRLAFCSTACPANGGETDATQVIADTYLGGIYPLTSNAFVYKCTGNTINGN